MGNSMFYERLLSLCEERGIKLTPLVKELGYSTGSLTNWKNGTIPSGDIVLAFAKYFDVSTDYLLGKDDIKKRPTPEEVELINHYRSISPEFKKFVETYLSLPPDKQRQVEEYAELLFLQAGLKKKEEGQ